MAGEHKGTILVVDDTATNLRIVFDWLNAEGYRVLTMPSGVQALEKLDQIEPDLILMDLMMPEMDGFETTARIKSQPDFEDIPVIVMTALTDVSSKVTAFDSGAVDYVTKPLERRELIARVKTHLELSRARKRLSEDNIAKQAMIQELNAFAHTVAHDLKNPLSIIMGYAETLIDYGSDYDADEVSEIYNDVLTSSKKMNQIIYSLLLLASTRDKEVSLQETSVYDVCLEARQRYIDVIDAQKADLQIAENIPSAMTYPDWLEEAVCNLVSNAVKYGGEPPIIKCGGRKLENGMNEYWIEDNGAGLNEEQVGKLFVAFERLSAGATNIEGTGLGLTIVQRIINRLGGDIRVESEVGVGTRFIFTLPSGEDSE